MSQTVETRALTRNVEESLKKLLDRIQKRMTSMNI